MLKKYLGPLSYYQDLFKIGLPIALSMLLTSCMAIVDSIMVSSIGMVTAVGNAYNILMLHDYILWGIEAGICMFAAQFYGANQKNNLYKIFGFGVLVMFLNALLWNVVVLIGGEKLLYFYLNDEVVVNNSLIYLKIAVLSLIPSGLNLAVSSLYRCSGNTRLPFIMSIFASIMNVILNYLFIMIMKIGVKGAALGTLLSQTSTLIIYIIIIYNEMPVFYNGLKDMFSFDYKFAKPVLEKSFPIMINEFFFGIGTSLFNKAFGILGTYAMDAYYIAVQGFDMFASLIWGFGGAVSIKVGNTLGQGELEKAKIESDYQLGVGFFMGLFTFFLMWFLGPLFMSLYHVTDELVYEIGTSLLVVFGLKAFFRTYNYMMFSTLKAGGDSKILNILDSGIMYIVGIPIAFISVYLGVNDIVLVLLLCQIEQLVRFYFTLKRYKSFTWVNDLTKLV